MQKTSTGPKSQTSFRVVTLPLGIGCGFAALHTYAFMYDSSLFRYHFLEASLVAMLVGGSVGLGFGLILDAKVEDSHSRKRLNSWLWTIYITGGILFLLFTYSPAVRT
jgi:predicted benzoate:H+ symporter BenE